MRIVDIQILKLEGKKHQEKALFYTNIASIGGGGGAIQLNSN